jgi:outer membrane protein
MIFKPFAAGLSAVAALAAASSAFAQAPAAAPAAQPPGVVHGPPIAGVCVVDVQGVIGASTVGRYVEGRLQQIGAQVKAELTGEQGALVNDAKAFDAQRATMDQNTQVQRNADLQKRDIALQQKAQQRQQELQATQQKALNRVYQEMQPLITQAYQQKNCSVLLSREGVMAANPAMDISQQVVTALNAKLTQFPFDRERLDQQALGGGGATAGAPPIVQTPSAVRPAAPAAPRPVAPKK